MKIDKGVTIKGSDKKSRPFGAALIDVGGNRTRSVVI